LQDNFFLSNILNVTLNIIKLSREYRAANCPRIFRQ